MITRITIYVLTVIIVAMGVSGILMTDKLVDKQHQITGLEYGLTIYTAHLQDASDRLERMQDTGIDIWEY